LTETSTDWAPWYVVPADHNWVRNLAVAELLVDALRTIDPQLPSSHFRPTGSYPLQGRSVALLKVAPPVFDRRRTFAAARAAAPFDRWMSDPVGSTAVPADTPEPQLTEG